MHAHVGTLNHSHTRTHVRAQAHNLHTRTNIDRHSHARNHSDTHIHLRISHASVQIHTDKHTLTVTNMHARTYANSRTCPLKFNYLYRITLNKITHFLPINIYIVHNRPRGSHGTTVLKACRPTPHTSR